jgi:hypothetical protein
MRNSYRIVPGRALYLTLLWLSGCAGMAHYQNYSAGNTQTESGPTFYQHPAVGDFLCLAVPNGTPIISSMGGGTIGYTGDEVAFGGREQGNMIQIVMPDASLQWIDGRVIKPYGTAYPGHTCYVFRPDGIHPKFVIN